MAVQLCEYTKKHYIVLFKWVSCILCELYLIIAAILIKIVT
jgi:hypothetical protein